MHKKGVLPNRLKHQIEIGPIGPNDMNLVQMMSLWRRFPARHAVIYTCTSKKGPGLQPGAPACVRPHKYILVLFQLSKS